MVLTLFIVRTTEYMSVQITVLDTLRQMVHFQRLITFLQKFSQVFITGTELEIDGATHIQLNKSKEVF